MSNVSKRRREGVRGRVKTLSDHKEFLKRISKSLYYGKLPSLPCLSLPVTEISAELFSEAQRGRSLRRLHVDFAAEVTRSACVSPCSLVLAILYLERLKTSNPEYVARIAPSQLFLVSLMVSNKFLQDDGEDEVFCDEWATSGGVDVKTLKTLEKNFLCAIDWKVFVSEEAFETGLEWLERQVAIKQANLRGFFTYADLAVSASNFGLADLLKSFSSICLALTVSYITSLLAVVTSTLLISNSLLPYLHTQTCSPAAVDSNSLIRPTDTVNATMESSINTTVNDREVDSAFENFEKFLTNQLEINKLTCCRSWWALNEKHQLIRTDWLDGVVLKDRQDTQQAWWWYTSAINWLYQFSHISPLQKWLDKAEEWSTMMKIDFFNYTLQSFPQSDKREYRVAKPIALEQGGIKCDNIWLNMGKFNEFISVSDR